jgi:hypothetical protein
MTLSRRSILLALPVAMTAGAARAHHGWGNYDSTKPFTLTGTITKAIYENPHTEIEMRVDGKTRRFVLAPPLRMRSRGLEAPMIEPGKTCTVHGYPHKTDPEEARIEYILIDGKRIELR